jgi:hypothetical protein
MGRPIGLKGEIGMKDQRTVYFSDRFFSSGITEIVDEQGCRVGELDLQSMFTSGVHVLDEMGNLSHSGKFRFFSNSWIITDRNEVELGTLKAKFSLFSKKYLYLSHHGEFLIESPAFSREYTVCSRNGELAAQCARTDSMLGAGSFMLTNHSSVPVEELILVVMGIHAIQKRRQSAATT